MSLYSSDDYRNKLVRNFNALDRVADENLREKYRKKFAYYQARIDGLAALEPDVRDQSIYELNDSLDKDYEDMGFNLAETEEETKSAIHR